MLEALICVTLAGLILSSNRRLGIANPFQIYFIIWFLIFSGYYLSREKYVDLSSDFILLLISVKLFSFLLLFVVFCLRKKDPEILLSFKISKSQDFWILLAQIAVIIALPFVYERALMLARGADIFTFSGHIKLRALMHSHGEGYGLLSYFFTLSYIVSSVTLFYYRQLNANFVRLLLSILASLFYLYLSTGRTHILLFSCLVFIPLIIGKMIKARTIMALTVIFISIFVFFSMTTGKGISLKDIGLTNQIILFWDHLQYYSIMPLVGFFQLIEFGPEIDLGKNTFRFFIALQYELGLSEIQPLLLIKDAVYVYDSINVYTVYEPYFRDFYYFGIMIPSIFLIVHYWLYQKAIRFGAVWNFYYAASVYPLTMQFFQDQYFSLLSTWIQIAFWYWFFIVPKKLKAERIALNHD